MSVILCKVTSLNFDKIVTAILSDRLVLKVPGKPVKNAVKIPDMQTVEAAIRAGFIYYNAGTKTPHGYSIHPICLRLFSDPMAFITGYEDGVAGRKKLRSDPDYTNGKQAAQQRMYRSRYKCENPGEDW